MRSLVAGVAALCAGCAPEAPPSAGSADVADRPQGWVEEVQGTYVPPDYAAVFGTDAVHRMDLRMDRDAYDTMMDEMVGLAGVEFGVGALYEDPTPEEVAAVRAACDGLAEEDACTVELRGVVVDAMCLPAPDGVLACVPPGPGKAGGEDGSLLDDDPSWVPADVEADGTTWLSVGFRLKGNSSLLGAWLAGVRKLPFRLDFDRFEDERPEIEDQRFFGFRELSFGNGFGDPTLLREVLAEGILDDAGVPVARSGYWWVTLDVGDGPVPLGLYVVTEDPADALLHRVWGSDAGNLYKPDGRCASLDCFEEASFEKKTNEEANEYADVKALIRALRVDDETADADWGAEVEAALDVDGFLRWLAVNSAMRNWDVYGAMSHNYYLYGVPADGGRLAWIPWDHNEAIKEFPTPGEAPMLDDVGSEWPLIRRLLDDPAWRDAYRTHLADALEGAYAEEALTARVADVEALVGDALYGGELAETSTFLGTEAEWLDAIHGPTGLLAFAASRRAEVEAALVAEAALAAEATPTATAR